MTIWTVAALVIGLVLLVGGAEALVKSASKLAATAGISPLVIGLTVVAFGTSAPELTVSLQASLSQQADIALGNVVGSNICNVLLILGISAMIAPLVVAQQLIRLDVPIMIGVSALVMLFGWDGQIGRSDGVILFLGGIAYTLFLLYQSRRDKDPVVQAEYAQFEQRSHSSKETALNVGLLVVGLVMLIAGSQLLIQSAVTIATLLGVSELMIGLTVVAVGTSLPELATSVTASLRGESDIAVGNVVGSNIFNILIVLGLSSAVSPIGTGVSPAAIAFDIPVMIAVAAMCLPICFTGNKISRKEGALLFTYYLLYVGYLATNMIDPDLPLPIWIGIVPVVLTLFTLLSWRTEKSPEKSPKKIHLNHR